MKQFVLSAIGTHIGSIWADRMVDEGKSGVWLYAGEPDKSRAVAVISLCPGVTVTEYLPACQHEDCVETEGVQECENCGHRFCPEHGQRGGDRQVQDVGAVAYPALCDSCLKGNR